MWRYGCYLRSTYQQHIMETLDSTNVTSSLQYDPSNNFVYAPIDRKVAFDCERILKDEEFVVRRNILYNIQASKYSYNKTNYTNIYKSKLIITNVLQ